MPSSVSDDHHATQSPPSPLGEDDSKKKGGSSDVQEGTSPTFGKGPQQGQTYDYYNEKEAQGAQKFHKLGWIKLVVVLIVEAIALGSLSMPS